MALPPEPISAVPRWGLLRGERLRPASRDQVSLRMRPTDGSVPWHLAISRTLGDVVVTVEGEVGARTSGMLGAALLDLIEGQGNLFVVVDLRGAVLAGPSGLDVLAAAKRSMEGRNGQFLLSAPSHDIRKALLAAGLADVIEAHPERRHHPSTGRIPPLSDGLSRGALG